MSLKLNCPRCERPLVVPSSTAGSYAHCPYCNGRLWVPDNVPSRPPLDLPKPPPPPPPPSPSTAPGPGAAPPPASEAPPPAGPGDACAAPPVQTGSSPKPPGKVARLISAEAAQSSLELTADGNLPELHLLEGDRKDRSKTASRAISPLLTVCLISFSAVLSVVLVLVDFGGSGESRSVLKQRAHAIIRREYFADQEHRINPDTPLQPYQQLLRRAERCDDPAGQRRLYRHVLKLLRVERGPFAPAVTGTRRRDEELEKQISILLDDD